MRHVIALLVSMLAAYWLPAASQPVTDSLHDTVAQIPDTAAYAPRNSESIPTPSPTSAPVTTEQNQAKAADSVKVPGIPADSFTPSEKPPTAAPIQQPAPSVSNDASSPAMALIDPDAVNDLIFGNSYRLPEDKLFLLGGNDLFIVSARLSKNIGIGMSGGPFYNSTLSLPYRVIEHAQDTAKATVEERFGSEAHSYYSSTNYITGKDIPFDADSYLLRDGTYFWNESTSEIDFIKVELKSLKWYLNARMPCGALSLMVKPLAYGQNILSMADLFRAEADPSQSTILFSKEGEITTNFTIRNLGIHADIAFSHQVNKALSLYARCPVEYRKITSDATRSFIALFRYFPDNYGEYTRHVKLDTLNVAKSSGYRYYFSPRLGVRLDAEKDLAWPFIFLPFVAQNATLEGYFTGSRFCQNAGQCTNYLYKQFGGSYTSFQKIRFGIPFISGMVNMTRLRFDCSYYDFPEEYYANISVEYTPQLIIKEHFFVSAPRLDFEIGSTYYFDIVSNHIAGFGYFNDTRGFSCRIGFSEARNKNMYPDLFNVTVWRSWK